VTRDTGDDHGARLADEVFGTADPLSENGWRDRKPLDLRTGDDPEAPDLLVDGLERGTVVALCADTGGAKSFTAQALIVAVAEEVEWLGKKLKTRHGHAVLIDEENPERILRDRLRALGLTPKGEPYVRAFHRLGVRLGAEGADWTEWLRHQLAREPADLVVIDTGIAATAPEVNDNDAVARLYTEHLRPLAAETGAVILLLLHEKKPQEGARIKQTFATMGARAWIGQADTQLMLAKRGKSEEEELEDGGYRLVSRFALATGKLRDGGAEIVEGLEIRSRLRADRALLEAEIVNEGSIEADPKTYDALDNLEQVLTEAGEPMQKMNIAKAIGVESNDRTFERALELGLEESRLEKVKRGVYGLPGQAPTPVQGRSHEHPFRHFPPSFRHPDFLSANPL
jgi:AAA domain